VRVGVTKNAARSLRTLALPIVLGAAAAACDDQSYRDIGAEIGLLTTRSDALVPPAIERLSHYRRRAIPQIEIALHTASDSGRRNLIGTLARIGDPEAVPILRHFAVYDLSPEIRAACETVLTEWARPPAPQAVIAQAALTRIAELRAAGEAPAPPRP
jgi:HEAT repeat protein